MSVYKRASGKWLVLIDVDRTETGKRIRKSLGTFSTKKEADRAEREALSARDRGVDLAPRTVKVEAVLNHYLVEREAHCGAKTLERYRELATRNILPTLGSRYVVKLKPAHIAEWLTGLRRSVGMNGKPLSAKTVRHAFGLLQGALRWAIRMQIVDRNICETVQPPSVPKSEAKALTHLEITNLLQAAAGTRWECFVMLALSTGARRGELCALTWSDIDVETATLTISKSLSQTRSGTAVKCTKSP
jgi:integrase